ncbi:MAG: YihY/virulence factor BrkB family protein [Candidatus Manganitrophus sp. SA1]|nr:YihY/virulence factor BrkB family protein [Candidatus Manganitrophus morganii]
MKGTNRIRTAAGLALTAAHEWRRDRCDGLSAALSFHLLLAATPFLAFVLLIAVKLFGVGWTQSHLLPVLVGWVGPHITAMVRFLLVEREQVEARSLVSLGIVGALALVIGASGYFIQLRDALQTIWDVRREPPGFMVQVRRRLFGILIALASALIALAGLTAATLALTSDSAFSVPTRWIVGTLIAFLAFWALMIFWFKILPPVRLTWREIIPWAALIALFHLLGKWIVSEGGAGADTPSNVGVAVSLILVMFWFYYANGIFLYGAELMRISLQRSGPLARSEPSGEPPRMRIAR